MTTQSAPGGLKTAVIRNPTPAEIEETADLVLEAENTNIHFVGRRGTQK